MIKLPRIQIFLLHVKILEDPRVFSGTRKIPPFTRVHRFRLNSPKSSRIICNRKLRNLLHLSDRIPRELLSRVTPSKFYLSREEPVLRNVNSLRITDQRRALYGRCLMRTTIIHPFCRFCIEFTCITKTSGVATIALSLT